MLVFFPSFYEFLQTELQLPFCAAVARCIRTECLHLKMNRAHSSLSGNVGAASEFLYWLVCKMQQYRNLNRLNN